MWFTDLVQLELWAQVIKVPDFCAAEIGEVELCRLHAKLIDKIANTVCGNLLREMHQHIDSCKQSLRDRVRASASLPLPLCFSVSLLLCFSVSLFLCLTASMPLCFSASLSLCFSASL
jgi:hypothetical protein